MEVGEEGMEGGEGAGGGVVAMHAGEAVAAVEVAAMLCLLNDWSACSDGSITPGAMMGYRTVVGALMGYHTVIGHVFHGSLPAVLLCLLTAAVSFPPARPQRGSQRGGSSKADGAIGSD
eukprot:TRINITY_DN79137_c0_g1_i1.p1 TRINITY_DN79137_c0_g1~~TRINITY_DN79137_c0_g1_i1.p1  ORF type:complete len:119 (-),score=2.94 TRINITY_DN79137_c0_g1_i1:73-429(-)